MRILHEVNTKQLERSMSRPIASTGTCWHEILQLVAALGVYGTRLHKPSAEKLIDDLLRDVPDVRRAAIKTQWTAMMARWDSDSVSKEMARHDNPRKLGRLTSFHGWILPPDRGPVIRSRFFTTTTFDRRELVMRFFAAYDNESDAKAALTKRTAERKRDRERTAPTAPPQAAAASVPLEDLFNTKLEATPEAKPEARLPSDINAAMRLLLEEMRKQGVRSVLLKDTGCVELERVIVENISMVLS
jgi:hypothetical protein